MTESSDLYPENRKAEIRGCFLRVRYNQIALLTFLIIILFGIRTCFSVAIVAMTTHNTSSNPDVPVYNWTNENIILSSFYWSYAVPQFAAGNLTRLFGTKWLLFYSVLVSSLSSIMIPPVAEYLGSNGVMCLRILQGLFQSFLIPLMNAILGRWVPSNELSLLNNIVYSGCVLGSVLSMIITGYLSASSWGWPAAFYLFGILGVILSILWIVFSADSPATHKTISKEERKYIEQSLGQENDHLVDKTHIPWKAIFKSVPYWAIIVAAIGESWGTTFLSSELPNYFSRAVGLNIEDSSLFSAAPHVGSLIFHLICGPIAMYGINKGYTSTKNSRRLFQGIGSLSITTGLLLIPFIEDKLTIAILLIFSVSLSSAITLGFLVNHVDISPRFSGALCGISNGTGQMIAIFAPILVHFIVTDETDKTLWRSMFILSAVICGISGIIFIILCSGERQWWDNGDKNELVRIDQRPASVGRTNEGFQNTECL